MGNTVPQHLLVDKEQEDGNYNDDRGGGAKSRRSWDIKE